MKILSAGLFLLFAVLMSSCEKNTHSGKVIDVGIEVKLLSVQGQNLLTPPTGFTEQRINLYHLVNGIEVLYNQSNLDMPKGFRVTKDQSNTDILGLLPNIDEKEQFPQTILKIADLAPDTIKCEIIREGSMVLCKRIWVNGQLKYDPANGGKRSISITKVL